MLEQIEYKVEYNKARIITANEIAWITGNTGFDERTNYSPYYFDTLEYDHLTRSEACLDNNPSTECKYGWLYDRTSNTCTNSGCFNNADTNNAYGYWTSTAASHTYYPFFVHAGGQIAYVDSVETSTSNGVRPVITILKSKR